MMRCLRGPTVGLLGLSIAGVAACSRDGKGQPPGASDTAPSQGAEARSSTPPVSASLPWNPDDSPRDASAEQLRDWGMKLITSIPEWEARAQLTARTSGQRLALVCDDELEPKGCDREAPQCRMNCEAIRTCQAGGCAGGRWLDFDVDVAQGTLFVSDESSLGKLPYGGWRDQFRSKMRAGEEPELRALLEPRQAFPVYTKGHGGLGYGAPQGPATPPSQELRALLERGGSRMIKSERYGSTGFPVFFVEGSSGLPQPAHGETFREWGAALVRANGLAACEVVMRSVGSEPTRFQFDRFVIDSPNGGVYLFTNGAFHPWLAS